jgi:hypothetical protein
VAYPAEGGEGIELMQAGRVQVVHNSPDAAFDTVDVYIEGELVGDDLTYRQATAALSYPSGIAVDVAITPSDSASDEDAIFVATPTLAAGATYAGIATGVSDPSQFEANPGGEDIAFDVKFGVVREVSDSWDMVQLKAFHGVTDAPAIDVVTAAGKQTLVDDLSYGQFSEFFMVDPAPVGLQVTPADQSSVVAQVDVDLGVFEGEALTLVASGFLTPGDLDQINGTDGPGFAILAIQADGTVAELKPSP